MVTLQEPEARKLEALIEHTRLAFNYEHTQSDRSDLCDYTPARVDELLVDIGLPRDWFRQKRVLDAGCGAGRWSYALAELGAQVTAVDFTESGVARTAKVLARYPDCRAICADLRELPASVRERGPFDLVFSWGVLHHTPDPRATFEAIARLVAPGGQCYVMVYGPTTAIQDALTNIVRAALRGLTPEQRYEACRAFVLAEPRHFQALWPYLYLYQADPRDAVAYERALFAAYDCYSPAFNARFSHPEVAQWFHEAGLEDITMTRPLPDAVHLRGRRP